MRTLILIAIVALFVAAAAALAAIVWVVCFLDRAFENAWDERANGDAPFIPADFATLHEAGDTK
jgi:hypothetical protein